MDWLKKMNEALNYIEDNLTEEIDYAVVAKKACCSSYNFQRMFSFITDITLAEYIRRRKLTNAAFELQNGHTIVDVPESTWAIFTSEKHGKDTMTEVTQKLNRRIYTEWFPNSKFDMIEGFDFELYKSDGEKCYEEIWFRVNPNMEKK